MTFTLGWIESHRVFKNVYPKESLRVLVDNDTTNSNNILTVKYENYRPSFMGKPIILSNTHGVITFHDDKDGFSVSGMNSSAIFKCPSGYGGPECSLKPICDAEHAGSY